MRQSFMDNLLLMLPGTAAAGELVNEHDRGALADLLIVELHAVVGGEMGHLSLRERYKSMQSCKRGIPK